jgi:hypothetical protein
VFIVDRNKKIVHLPPESKAQVARKLLELVAEFVNSREARSK